MGYVDLRRREKRAREKRGGGGPCKDVKINPYLCVAGGSMLGVVASWIVVSTPDGYTPFLVHLPIILIVLAGMGLWRLR